MVVYATLLRKSTGKSSPALGRLLRSKSTRYVKLTSVQPKPSAVPGKVEGWGSGLRVEEGWGSGLREEEGWGSGLREEG